MPIIKLRTGIEQRRIMLAISIATFGTTKMDN